MKRYATLLILIVFAVAGFTTWKYYYPAHQEPVRIAINPWPGYEFLYLAEQKGFLKEEGLNIELKHFSSLEDVRLAFERGQVDGTCSTTVEVIQAYANHKKLAKIVILADYSNGADMILANNSINSVKDLKGRKVAVESKSINLLVLASALKKNGMTLHDVKLKNYSSLDMPQALAQKKVDAVVIYPPMSIEAEKVTGVHRIFDSKQIQGEILDVIAVTPEVIRNNPNFVPALKKVWTRSLAYWREHTKEAEALMAAREGITPEEFHEALQSIATMEIPEQEALIEEGKLKGLLQLTAESLRDTGDLRTSISDVEQFIYTPEK